MKKLFLALPLLALAACGGSASDSDGALGKDVLMHSDIDALAGWICDPTALHKGEAHSGQWTLYVSPDHEYSAGYNAILGQLSPTRLRGIRVDVWVFVPNKEATAKLEVVIKDASGKEIMRDRTALEEVSTYEKWVKVSKDIILPKEANYSSQLAMYTSRSGATSPVYLDDISLTALR